MQPYSPIAQPPVSGIYQPVLPFGTSEEPSNEFDQLVERLDKKSLLDRIDALPDRDKVVESVVELASTRDYRKFSDLFTSKDFEYYGLYAVQKGRLSALQFATLMFVRAGLGKEVKVEDLEVFPLFTDDAPSSAAWLTIPSTFSSKFELTKEKRALFIEEMRAMPPSEKYFVVVPDTRNRNEDNVSWRINAIVGFNIFSTIPSFCITTTTRMIPSFGMIQAFLNAKESNGVSFKLVIGESTAESIRISMLTKGAREMCVHCPELAPAPSIADNHFASPLDFMYHDFYHLIITSTIPAEDRRFFCEAAEHFNKDDLIYQSYYEALIDMEIQGFPLDSPPLEQELKGQMSCKALNAIIKNAKYWRDSKSSLWNLSKEQEALIESLNEKLRGLHKEDNLTRWIQ